MGVVVLNNKSNSSYLGNILGMLLGNSIINNQTKGILDKAQILESSNDVNGFLEKNSDLKDGISSGVLTPELLSKYGGANLDSYNDSRNAYQGIMKATRDYQEATTDEQRQLAHADAEHWRGIGEKLGITNLGQNNTYDDFNKSAKNMDLDIISRMAKDNFNQYSSDMYKKATGKNRVSLDLSALIPRKSFWETR